MKILEYYQFNPQGVQKQYNKLKQFIEQDDFYSAEVKKLQPTNYYRAKLDITNRVLFKVVEYQGQKYALMLEVIYQHTYEKSKFLNGAKVDESKIIENQTALTSEPMAYVNQHQPNIHIQRKLLSFDDEQQAIFQLPPPVIIIGPAGSGKTALTIEKMKSLPGKILYITHSSYLVHNSRDLYYAHHETNEDQQVDFFSYQEFLESIQVPNTKEVSFKQFNIWLSRHKQQLQARDPHKLYEEFKGVLSGTEVDKLHLSLEDYLNLGIKQSIYLPDERKIVYDLYLKYLKFLKEQHFHDINLLSFDYLQKVKADYDFIVVDEVQDFTNIQLTLILKTLKTLGQFILCGDSNQIVHPNFFAWSKVKTLFYQNALHNDQMITRVLQSNYRSAQQVTELSNKLLKLKNVRLGSIDKESNYLMKSTASVLGAVNFLSASNQNVKLLNEKTKLSTKYAVLVLRDELKAQAQQSFDTPLIFSIREVKGLEYENVIIYDFISAEIKAYLALTQEVDAAALMGDELNYSRAKDKSDKSLEIYKFYINALYVATTRAITNIYWVESNKKHPLIELLGIKELQNQIDVAESKSSTQEWQQEARRLEMQGKQDQADAIRDKLLKAKQVPWQVLNLEVINQRYQQMQNGRADKKLLIELLEYATVYHHYPLIDALLTAGVKAAANVKKCQKMIEEKYLYRFQSSNFAHVMKQTEQYGIDFRNIFNLTPLMIAAYVGNHHLIEVLLNCGANTDLLDNMNKTAWQIAMRQALFEKEYAKKYLADVYYLLAPDSLIVEVDAQLIKLDMSSMEFLLIQLTLIILEQHELAVAPGRMAVITAQTLEHMLVNFPEKVLPAYRKRRSYISSILAKNEIDSANSYGRKLFRRVRRGYYIINPNLRIKMRQEWFLPLQHIASQPGCNSKVTTKVATA